MYVYIYLYICIYICICIQIYIINIFVNKHYFMCVCVCVCVYIYIYIYPKSINHNYKVFPVGRIHGCRNQGVEAEVMMMLTITPSGPLVESCILSEQLWANQIQRPKSSDLEICCERDNAFTRKLSKSPNPVISGSSHHECS